jgi:hypothetical protein
MVFFNPMMMNQNTKDCPICYESYDNSYIIDCPNNHVACCLECLGRLLNNRCPICRDDLNEHITTSTTTTTTTTTRTSSRLDLIRRREAARRDREERDRFNQRMWDERDRREERERAQRELLAYHRELIEEDQTRARIGVLLEENQPLSNNTPPRAQEDQTYDNNIQAIVRNHRNEEQRHRSEAQRARRDRERRDKTYSQQSRRTQLRWGVNIVERSLDRQRAENIRANDLFNHRSMGQRQRRQRERAARLASS